MTPAKDPRAAAPEDRFNQSNQEPSNMAQTNHSVINALMQLLTEEDRARIVPLKAAVQVQQEVFSKIANRRDLAARRAGDFEQEAERLENEKRSEMAPPQVDALLNADLSAALDYSSEEIATIKKHNEDISTRQCRAKNITNALRDEEKECAEQAKLEKARLSNAELHYYRALADVAADLHDRALWQVLIPLFSYFNSLRTALGRNLEGGTGRLDLILNQATLSFWENNSFTRVWPPTGGDGYDRFLQRKGVSLTEPTDALDAMVGALSAANPRD
jgi:hypothetical protein